MDPHRNTAVCIAAVNRPEVSKIVYVAPPLYVLINFTSPFQNECEQIIWL
jgi:hypothetical protein